MARSGIMRRLPAKLLPPRKPTGSPVIRSPPRLLTGLDPTKDQSYVLFGTPRERLHRMLLPIGEMTKQRTRELAEQWELPVFNKPDSQEICFVPDQDYAGLIRRRSPEQVHEGEIRDTAGHRLGSHPGHQHFTLGQRRGLGLSHPTPLYVVDKDAATNTLVVGSRDELLADGAMADQVNWLADDRRVTGNPAPSRSATTLPAVPGRVRARRRRIASSELRPARLRGHPGAGAGVLRRRKRARRRLGA